MKCAKCRLVQLAFLGLLFALIEACLLAAVNANENWPGPAVDGLHRVAFDQFGSGSQSPHLVTGNTYYLRDGMVPVDKLPADHPARAIVYGDNVRFDFRGLNPEAEYKVRLTYLSDHPQGSFPARVVQLSADGEVLQDKRTLPEDEVDQQLIDVPAAMVADGRLTLEIAKLEGNNAVVSAVELFSTDEGGLADVLPAQVFSHHMVLQRDRPCPVWGWAEPNQKITVRIASREASTVADENGKWRVTLEPMQAGGPYEMTFTGERTLTLRDVYVGEVWVCSGQSNMDMMLGPSGDTSGYTGIIGNEKFIDEADQRSQIRVFHTPTMWSDRPLDKSNGEWVVTSSDTVGKFSAVGYLFARDLQQELDVPVGILWSSVGGSPIENWMPGPSAVWFNGMLHPCIPYGVRGVVWYQGETNLAQGAAYFDNLDRLIGGWRDMWGQGQFPFLIVQVAPYKYLPGGWPAADATPDMLPKFWEAQAKAARVLPNTGMVVTTDVGDLEDIHPRDKYPISQRLAKMALAKAYGQQKLVHAGPTFDHYEIRGDRIVLHLQNTGSGLAARDDKPLDWFEVAGADQKFVPATAKIEGDAIVVSSPNVPQPVAVRFGWDQSAQPNLVNREGFPALPFRTDRW